MLSKSSPLNITAERVNRGLSIPAAAAAMMIAEGTLAAAERGSRPQARTAKRIADFYGVRVTDIWPIEDEAA